MNGVSRANASDYKRPTVADIQTGITIRLHLDMTECDGDDYPIEDVFPICRTHGIPLTRHRRAGYGVCSHTDHRFDAGRGHGIVDTSVIPQRDWVWRLRAGYDPFDIPPGDGTLPPIYEPRQP